MPVDGVRRVATENSRRKEGTYLSDFGSQSGSDLQPLKSGVYPGQQTGTYPVVLSSRAINDLVNRTSECAPSDNAFDIIDESVTKRFVDRSNARLADEWWQTWIRIRSGLL